MSETWDYEVMSTGGEWINESRTNGPPDTELFVIRNLRKREEDPMRLALDWYAQEAEAIAKNLASKNDTALLASVTVLGLDGGKTARKALAQLDPQPPGWVQCPECLAAFPLADAQDVGAMEYRGNTVSYMYDRARAYGDRILRLWSILREHGNDFSGRSIEIDEALREALSQPLPAAQARAPMTIEQIDAGMDQSMMTRNEVEAFGAGVRFAEKCHGIAAEPAAAQARAPMTDEQISNRLWEAEWPEVMLSDFVRAKLVVLIRSVERHHGIAAEQGKR